MEREIKELKEGVCHKLLWSRAPKHLWDDCLKLEDREVLETMMSGKKLVISQFCELLWFKWVVFWDETAPFPNDVLKLGCYLGPSIDVGPAMTTKILTENGQVLHRSAYKPLTPDELPDKDGSDAQDQFMARVYERLWSLVLPRGLEDKALENTPQYDPYEDEMKNEQMCPQLEEEIELMPEVGDH